MSAKRYFLCAANWIGSLDYYLPRRICGSWDWALCIWVNLQLKTFGCSVPTKTVECADHAPALPGKFEQPVVHDERRSPVYIFGISCWTTFNISGFPKVVKGNSHVAQSGGKAQSIPHHLDSCPRTDGCLGVGTSRFRFPIRIQ